ncbi:MAG: tripartite tricarboxylate transporter permease [Candidatus Rokubacteria bacterium]|nr:tripartite tricarboxylate transporter permease [Candidatus Rokubacteria bacterium]
MVDFAQASVAGLVQVFTWPTFGLMLVGIAIGFVVGILPGLGGPTTLALMLPFVFKMTPVEAFAFLLGMFAVTGTTGDITSILFGIPGEPTSAATIVDGHAMAKNGEAGRALGAAMMSSLIGAVFGALVLALAIPVVRPLVLSFGSPEFFMLAVLGVTFVAALSGEAPMKGLVAGGLGLGLATIGLDPVSGTQRYTFGQLFLWDGIGLVAVTIGFYAIPEVIELAVQGSSIARLEVDRLGGVWQGVRDTFHHWLLVVRCSAVGTFVSIIPGMGAATTQWLAYAHAVQTSPDRRRFGRGAVEGVLGPGAANNSSLGGSLVTTVAFGVPASVGTAILMGAFLIQGLVPGPSMLMPPPRGHLVVTFSMVWTIVVSNVITVAICFLFLKQLVRITQVRGTLLIPFILTLIYVGAFAEKNVFEDLGIVLAFGALGWVMARLAWPRPPLLLGLVLGPLAENKLFLSIGNYGAAWLLRPGVLGLLAVIVVGLVLPIWSARRRRPHVRPEAPPEAAGREPRPGPRLDAASAFSLLLVLVLAGALWQSREFGTRAGLFPWAIGIPTLALALVQLGRDLAGRRSRGPGDAVGGGAGLPAGVAARRTAEIGAWIAGGFVAIWLLGFPLATLVATFLYLKVGGRERWPISLGLSLAGFAFVYGLFERGLAVPFPPGRLLVWLGLAA